MSAVKNRSVWYFHGFDPASTARYRRIFEAASGRLSVTLEDLPDQGDGWRVRRGGVVSDIHYCRYEDLVRRAQAGSVVSRLGRGVRALAGYGVDGALGRIARRAPRTLALMLSPFCVAFVPLAVAAALGGGDARSVVILLAVVLGSGLALRRLYLTLVADLFAYMRMLACGAGTDHDAYEARIAALAASIEPHATGETLVVGHSLGGIAAIRAMEALLDRLPPGACAGLLTLGSVHGIVLTQQGPGRDRLAAAIRRITADRRVFWVDVTSPRDAFCLPLLDPLVLAGDGAAQGAPPMSLPPMISPRVISARLTHAPRIPGDRRTVFGAMRRHMGYLLAPEQGAGFDYADTVTGALDLRARFGARGNSPKARMWQR